MKDVNKISEDAVKDLINETLNRFVGMPISEDLVNSIVYNLRELLSPRHLDDVKHFEFDLTLRKCDPSIVDLTPKNLFTLLLISGVIVPYDLVRDLDKWVTPEGIYRHSKEEIVCEINGKIITYSNTFEPFHKIERPWKPDKDSNTRNK